ncbi:MAG: adenylate/guanylate cyclase domain-containing protein [Campylobacterota bacterium]|nr:adenylate/guanylate cyclase domain-containing protein [Campylobacterota bacterium]
MKKRIKNFLIYTSTIIFISFIFELTYLYLPKTIDSFDDILRDYMFVIRGEVPNDNNVIIVDIDDKSLHEVGQWPWSRDIVSNMLVNLTNSNVGLIAFDVVFPEKDRTNPKKIIEEFNINTDILIPDFDSIFAQTVANTPTILGYQFQLEKDNYLNKNTPTIPAIFIEKNRDEFNKKMVIEAYGTILNIPEVQNSSYSSGFFNNIPDKSGVVRSVPLVIRYDERIYPSLALEIIRTISNKKKVYINYDRNGVENIRIGDLIIPTDRYGRSFVNFKGYEKNFKYISAYDILQNNYNIEDIEGKIVIIGTSAAGLLDLRATPFDSVYPGVEVHANLIDNILNEDYIYKPSWVDGLNMFHILLITVIIVGLVANLPLYLATIFTFFIAVINIYILYFILFNYGLIINIFFPLVVTFISYVVAVSLNYFLEVKYNKDIKNKFASKVSKNVMESLIHNMENDTFEATSKEITVFFSDIRGFTNISEVVSNERILIELLNEYMDPMTDIIIKNYGTVDKFIGDAIMAYWNAPGDIKNHANKAVEASLEQLYILDSLNKKIKKDIRFKEIAKMSQEKSIPIFEIGIGINTGVAIVGEMGSSQRSDYTVIGDPINLGSRMESLCKYYGSFLNISNYTKEQLPNNYIYRYLDLVTVKGKNKPVQIWQIIDYDNDMGSLYNISRERLDEELELYHRALDLYQNEKFSDALGIFKEVNLWEDKSNNKIYDIYIQRCEHYIKMPPDNFDGIFRHNTKS